MDETRAVSGDTAAASPSFTDADTRFDALHASVLIARPRAVQCDRTLTEFWGLLSFATCSRYRLPEGLDTGSGGAR
jgi:hypothetical protein